MKCQRLGRRAFTLVEIAIVVSLIGLLAVVAIPNYITARNKTSESSCISNLRRIEDAAHVWAFENRRAPASSLTFEDIHDYLKGSVVCPSGGRTFADSYQLTTVDEPPTCRLVPGTHLLGGAAMLAVNDAGQQVQQGQQSQQSQQGSQGNQGNQGHGWGKGGKPKP
jgi:prepilin-type N-terminal cleavage/methylation domain-containing protein